MDNSYNLLLPVALFVLLLILIGEYSQKVLERNRITKTKREQKPVTEEQ